MPQAPTPSAREMTAMVAGTFPVLMTHQVGTAMTSWKVANVR